MNKMKKKKYQNVRIISKVNIKIKTNFPGLVQLLTADFPSLVQLLTADFPGLVQLLTADFPGLVQALQ